jgi:hypothetical protein
MFITKIVIFFSINSVMSLIIYRQQFQEHRPLVRSASYVLYKNSIFNSNYCRKNQCRDKYQDSDLNVSDWKPCCDRML